MAVQDLHSLDVSEVIKEVFTTGGDKESLVLKFPSVRPHINIGSNTPIIISGRTKGSLLMEGAKKTDTSATIKTKPFRTTKIIYSHRFTNEFLTWDDQRQRQCVGSVMHKFLKGDFPQDLDIVVLHARDPKTGTFNSELEPIVKTGNCKLVPKTGDDGKDFADAVRAVGGSNVNGIALSTEMVDGLAKVKDEHGNQAYPECGLFGIKGSMIQQRAAGASPSVNAYNNTRAIVGDWSKLLISMAGNATWKVIEYGDPDNTGVDLQGSGQVCVQLEIHFGFQVLDPDAFAVVAGSVLSTS